MRQPTDAELHRGEVMRGIVKRGKPHNENVRELAQEYYEALACESYPKDTSGNIASRKLLVEMQMETFDEDFVAFYVLFGAWLRQG
jgi:hypothetical protein